ncbi:hypothetical protein LOD99_16296 [Oopsacas minuta]|uniref:Dol-P-Glc:Glc(2)Man(9)GlcNAc(2)-PP-Dol alpha-1,2-glucosyltransferase n=1 Tax=Oopsacas minuta TaxID=111878 RepID=A0AAV7K8F0_9METZ|nr:hypothetical protein LOD99_16296 [Oopsacas minuta]
MKYDCPVLLWFSSLQPGPYMDEIFHIPQAQNYCMYNFSHWDMKLTTPPGLYISSLMIYFPISLFKSSLIELCSVFNLRTTNIIFSSLNSGVLFLLLRVIHPKSSHLISSLYAFTLSLFPVLYFFSFLYYTDQGSTFLVLSALLATKHSHHVLSAVIFALSLCFRQTNIIWLCFAASCTLLTKVEGRIRSEAGLVERLAKACVYLLLQLRPSIRTLLPYMLVCIAFSIFIVLNGGIVLGDKSQHQITLHFSQVSYYILLTAVFTWSHMIMLLKRIISNVKLVVICFILLTLLFILFARFSTVTHPYLLADNRHFTFFFWRKIINYSEYTRYYLSLPYAITAILITSLLVTGSSELLALIYWVCVVLVLCLQPLIEFRYYIMPYLLFRIHSTQPSIVTLILDLLTYSAFNVATFYLFAYKPFFWEGSIDVQRFMW